MGSPARAPWRPAEPLRPDRSDASLKGSEPSPQKSTARAPGQRVSRPSDRWAREGQLGCLPNARAGRLRRRGRRKRASRTCALVARVYGTRECGRPAPRSARFAEEVESLAASRGVDMLLPGSDATLLALACHGDPSRSGIWSKVPPPNAIKRALDKVALIDCAEQIGHPGPPTVVCRDLGQAIAAADAFGYPVVLKPRRSVSEHDGTLLQWPGVLVSDTATLERLAAELGTPFLVQRREQARSCRLEESSLAGDCWRGWRADICGPGPELPDRPATRKRSHSRKNSRRPPPTSSRGSDGKASSSLSSFSGPKESLLQSTSIHASMAHSPSRVPPAFPWPRSGAIGFVDQHSRAYSLPQAFDIVGKMATCGMRGGRCCAGHWGRRPRSCGRGGERFTLTYGPPTHCRPWLECNRRAGIVAG